MDYLKTQIASFRQELRTDKGFYWLSWNQAANWCLQRNTNLEEALLWADSASSRNFGGEFVFTTWVTKAKILEKLGRNEEAADVMKKALPMGSIIDIHQYGRTQPETAQRSAGRIQVEFYKIPKSVHHLNGTGTWILGRW